MDVLKNIWMYIIIRFRYLNISLKNFCFDFFTYLFQLSRYISKKMFPCPERNLRIIYYPLELTDLQKKWVY